MNSLSVSIVTYQVDRAIFTEVLDALDDAIANAKRDGVLDYADIVVVDNGDDFSFLLDLTRSRDGYQVLQNEENTGFGRGHNRAIITCDADLHLVLNPDAILAPDALTQGVAYLESQKDTVMVSPYAEHPDGSKAYLCKRYPSLVDLAIRGFLPAGCRRWAANRMAQYECHDYEVSGVTRRVSIVSGCCMLVRASKLHEVGGFNEAYFLYFEDFDLSLKLARLGSIDYVPDMRIVHYGGGASRKGFRHIALFCKSAITFFMENGWKLA